MDIALSDTTLPCLHFSRHCHQLCCPCCWSEIYCACLLLAKWSAPSNPCLRRKKSSTQSTWMLGLNAFKCNRFAVSSSYHIPELVSTYITTSKVSIIKPSEVRFLPWLLLTFCPSVYPPEKESTENWGALSSLSPLILLLSPLSSLPSPSPIFPLLLLPLLSSLSSSSLGSTTSGNLV